MQEKLILTEKELADKIGVSVWTIRNWRENKNLPHFRTDGKIFYQFSSVEEWFKTMQKKQRLKKKLRKK